MAIIEAFKEWKHYLKGANHKVKVYTDHKNLTSFTTTKDLNKRQIRWYETLTDYDFEIIYRKGSENGRADALSRREDLKSEEQVDNAPLLRTTKDGNLVLGTREINATWQAKPDDTWMQKIASHMKKDSYLDNWETKPHLSKEGETFLYNERQYVPSTLQEQLVREIHEHPLHGHQGVGKTINRLRRSYDFPESRKTVQQVVDKCDICRKAKAARHAPYGELQPIPPPERAWQTVTMDFIVKLPKSKEPMTGAIYDSILVIVDKLTKYAYYIPYMESSDAKDLAYMFFKTVVAQHGLPTKLISDRDKLFTSNFWKCLMETMKIKQGLSTAFHPQSDGQTEILNQVLEQYLRSYVNYRQDDWVVWLPLAQWAYNSSEVDSMKMSPLKANYGFDPTIEIHAARIVNAPAATIHAETITEVQKHLQEEWIFLQNRMKHYADKKRLPAPILEEGHKVYLIRKNIKTKRPSDKLDWKKIGPFLIKRKISNTNYELSLPDGMKIHPIFHVSLLEKAPDDSTLATGIMVEDTNEYEVERILKERGNIKNRHYLVKWKGYPNSENTWEPIENLTNCSTLLEQFHSQGTHPNQSHEIQILGRSRKDPCGLLKLFRFLPFHALQFFDIVDTTRNRAHHFLEP
ncbi:pol protein [Beauveria brongniartii RCEF 3172]|uniref:Pol protein n=1 Tax=Beauveria brongniartii RCEF 3172 TaxID=1081107 RepID=A0A167GES1_9HYPO|nr:pol protein [Beauveria brongniartii RCEF 3172]